MMPSRKKAPAHDTKAALGLSFREYGGKINGAEPHYTFFRMVTMQAVNQTLEKHDKTNIQFKEIPKDREEAIQMVFALDLIGYLDKEMFVLKSQYADDELESVLKHNDDSASILGWAPFFLSKDTRRLVTKKSFESFALSRLDPFRRFRLRRESLAPHELALQDCSDDAGWLNGYAFEALTVSHAVWSQKCFRCSSRALRYCGGFDTSWRDLICSHCHSCYEIKSKENKERIDKIVKFDGFDGGSFKAWCAEDFSGRIIGTDFVVFVNRKPLQDGSGWAVYVAEIGTVLPSLCDKSFAQAGNKDVPIKTRVTMKNRPQLWFKIPGGDLTLNDFQRIFEKSYKEVFPGKSSGLSFQVDQETTSVPPPVNLNRPTTDVDDLRGQFAGLRTRDSWEDHDSD